MNISAAQLTDLEQVKLLYSEVTQHLRENGNKQWDRWYPNGWVVKKDIKAANMFVILQDGKCAGAVVVDREQSRKYDQIDWMGDPLTAGCIHRLAVHPQCQGQGIGKALLAFAENLLLERGCRSIRLDAYTGNPTAISLYERSGYLPRGLIRFPLRKLPYQCFEKELNGQHTLQTDCRYVY